MINRRQSVHKTSLDFCAEGGKVKCPIQTVTYVCVCVCVSARSIFRPNVPWLRVRQNSQTTPNEGGGPGTHFMVRRVRCANHCNTEQNCPQSGLVSPDRLSRSTSFSLPPLPRSPSRRREKLRKERATASESKTRKRGGFAGLRAPGEKSTGPNLWSLSN